MHKRKYYQLVIFYLFILESGLFGNCLNSQVLSGNPDIYYRFSHISTEHGLPQSSVVAIHKDKKGFLWLGTYNGLSRYDGKNLRNFYHDPSNPNSISINMIWSIAEDQNGDLWIATWGGGLNQYLAKEDRFIRYMHTSGDNSSIASDIVRCVTIGPDKKIWLGTEHGLSVLDPVTRQIKNFKVHDNPSHPTNNAVICLFFERNDLLWIGTNGGLVKFNPQNGKILKEYRNISEHLDPITYNAVTDIIADKSGKLWIATWGGGLQYFNPTTLEIEHFVQSNSQTNSISNNIVMDLEFDQSGKNLWIASRGGGIDIYNLVNKIFRHIVNKPDDPNSLSSNYIYKIYIDNDNIAWVGTDYAGLNKFNLSKSQFGSIRYSASDKNGMKIQIPTALLEDSKGNLWIGGNGGFEKYDPLTKKYSLYKFKYKESFLDWGTIRVFSEDTDGSLWIGSDGGGVVHFFPNTGQSISYTYDPNDPQSLAQDYVYDIIIDKFGKIWIGTQNRGISVFDKGKNNFEQIIHDPKNPASLPEDMIRTLFKSSDNTIWIGTNTFGLVKYDYQSNSFKAYTHNEKDKSSICGNYINIIQEDGQGNIWVGTMNSGLSLLDVKTGKFRNFTESESLSNNRIFGILTDKDDNIWVSTDKGLNRIDKKSLSIINYYKEDGLFHHEFQIKSYTKSSNGELFFGSRGGIIKFDPFKIKINSKPPLIEITEIKISNRSIQPNDTANQYYLIDNSAPFAKRLIVDYPVKELTIEFAAMNFSSPEKNQYAYKLIGFDSDTTWNYVGNKTSATYTHLPNGKYKFVVIGSNSDGAWNMNGREFEIIVKPPFWMRWWFRLIVFIAIGFTVFSIWRWRTGRIRQRSFQLEKTVRDRTMKLQEMNEELSQSNELLREKQIRIEEQTEELAVQKDELMYQKEYLQKINAELNKSNSTKDRLFSIISHDLRSPFNVIIGFSDLLVKKIDVWGKEKQKEYASHILNSARNIFTLLDNLLMWSRTQQNIIQFQPKRFFIEEITNQVLSLMDENAKQKSIEIKNNIRPECNVFADRNMIEAVVRNLISNAIKFSSENGSVEINCILNNKEWIFTVKDEGIGIPDDSKDKIFDSEVYTTKGTKSEKGTGLGLLICKEFVSSHGGKIWFESAEGKGSTFYFSIPNDLDKKEIDGEGIPK